MTVPFNMPITRSYTGDGTVFKFAINSLSGEDIEGIIFFFKSEIEVKKNNVLQKRNIDYVITSETPPSSLRGRIVNAKVEFLTPPENGDSIEIVYIGNPSQTSSFVTGQNPDPETIEFELDRAAVNAIKSRQVANEALVGSQAETTYIGSPTASAVIQSRFGDVKIQAENSDDEIILGYNGGEFLKVGDNYTEFRASGVLHIVGSGTPEGNVTAPVSSFYHRTDGTATTAVYFKAIGSGNTGWAALDVTSSQDFVSDRANFNVFAGDEVAPNLVTTGTGFGGSGEPGKRNVIIGDRAGNAITTGHWNVIVGEQAGEHNTLGKANTFLGRAAFQNNADSVDCVAIGEAAGAGVITGNSSTFIGVNPGILSGLTTYMEYFYDMGMFGLWERDPNTNYPVNGDSNYPDWPALTAVAKGELRRATPNGKIFTAIFKSNSDRVTRASFDAIEEAEWTFVSSEHPTGLWAPFTWYDIGDVVKGEDPLTGGKRAVYKAKTSHTSGATFSSSEVSANWTLLFQVDPVEPISAVTSVGSGSHFSINGRNNTVMGFGAMKGNERYTAVRSATATTVQLALNSSPEDDWYQTDEASSNPRRLCIMSGTGSTATYGVATDYSEWAPSTTYAAGTYFTAPYSEVRNGALAFRPGTGLYKVPSGGLTSGTTFDLTEAARYERIGIFSGAGASQIFIMVVDMISYDAATQTLTVPATDTTLDTTSTYQITIFNYDFRYRTKDSTYRSSNNCSFGIDNLQSAETITAAYSFGRRGLFNLRNGFDCGGLGELHGALLVSGDPMTDQSNVLCLGNDTRVSGSNQVQLGNSSHTVYASSSITVRSDKRDKTDIELLDSKYLDLIDHLDMYTFRWDKREYYTYLDRETDEWVKVNGGVPNGSLKGKRKHLGTIAQEVVPALNKVGLSSEDFAPLKDSAYDGNGQDVLSIQYEGLVPILWQAVKELRKRVSELEKS